MRGPSAELPTAHVIGAPPSNYKLYSTRGDIATTVTAAEVMAQTAVRSSSLGGQYLHVVSLIVTMGIRSSTYSFELRSISPVQNIH